MNIVQQAKEFAIKAHGDQKYGKMPYEYHLQQVVSKLTYWRDLGQWEITDTHLAVAWLHDVMEDTNTTFWDLSDLFSSVVATPVMLLSKHEDETREEYLLTIKSHPVSKIVKIADTFCNLEASILSGEMKRVNKYSKQLASLTED